MSHPSLHNSGTPPAQPDLDAARRNLESAMKAFLACCQHNGPVPPECAPPDTALERFNFENVETLYGDFLENPRREMVARRTCFADKQPFQSETALEEGGETRHYYFPPQAVRRERALLGEHRAGNLAELLEQAHYHIMGLARLMKSAQPNAKLRGQAISSLGTLLEQAAMPMLRMRTIYDQVRRVPAGTK